MDRVSCSIGCTARNRETAITVPAQKSPCHSLRTPSPVLTPMNFFYPSSMSPTQREYQIQYAVFFNRTTASLRSLSNPFLSNTLIPFYNVPKLRKKRGSWLSSSTNASLRLLYSSGARIPASQVMLVITVSDKKHEEHFISKLHFSWPLISIASENPINGGNVVFASYKDTNGQKQKFAMRFPSIHDSVSFIDALKGNLKNVQTMVISKNDSESAFQSQDGCIPLENLRQNLTVGVRVNTDRPMQPPPNNEGRYQETLLQSFAAFIAKQNDIQKENSNVPKDDQPFSYLVNSMNSASFMAVLYSMDKMVTDLGGDLSLQQE